MLLRKNLLSDEEIVLRILIRQSSLKLMRALERPTFRRAGKCARSTRFRLFQSHSHLMN